jgi:hypothetical protein
MRISAMLVVYKRALLVFIIGIAGLVVITNLVARPTAAQESSSRMRALLESLRDSETSLTIEFVRPLVSGESTWTLPDETAGRRIAEVGEDYVCFSEPWNDSFRNRCTPLTNLVTISYIE